MTRGERDRRFRSSRRHLQKHRRQRAEKYQNRRDPPHDMNWELPQDTGEFDAQHDDGYDAEEEWPRDG